MNPSGPQFKSLKTEGETAIITFDNAKGIFTKNDEIKAFAIAGADKKFHLAKASIDGDSVKASTPHVKNPVAVRYGWASCPTCNLYNDDNLPAAPFRSDNW